MRLKRFAIVAGAAAALTLGSAAPAFAGDMNGVCEAEEACLYWGDNFTGATADYVGRVDNFGQGYTFTGPGSGHGELVEDNVASARNLSGTWNMGIWLGRYYTGPSNWWPPGTGSNLTSEVKNQNSSLSWWQ